MKRKIGVALVIILQLTIGTARNPALSNPKQLSALTGTQVVFESAFDPVGSMPYVRDIRLYAEKYGSRAALQKIMKDVDESSNPVGRNDYTDNRRLYETVSSFIGQIGHVDRSTHYFRNRLNRSPETLEGLLRENGEMPKIDQWRLACVKGSLYHMQGPDGIYNLKFLSSDGFCEAVYNRAGILLTESNDPVNMGTFNYSAGISQENAHMQYDIVPYLQWGNTPDSPQKGYGAIQAGVREAAEAYNRNIAAVTAYRQKYENAKGAAYAGSPLSPVFIKARAPYKSCIPLLKQSSAISSGQRDDCTSPTWAFPR